MSAQGSRRILHLAVRADWEQARRDGSYTISTRGQSLAGVGFIHASTAAQLPGVRSAFYADLPDADLVVLHLDVGALEAAGSPVRWEPVAGQLFPHVYGPLPVAAVIEITPVPNPGDPPLQA